jgi:hypothetical protein
MNMIMLYMLWEFGYMYTVADGALLANPGRCSGDIGVMVEDLIVDVASRTTEI